MKLLAFNLTKIFIEKQKDSFQNLKINNNIDVSSISDVKQDFLKSEEELLSVKFSYELNYEPNIAKIAIEGKILVSVEQKTSADILSQWKEKKIPEDFKIPLFNIIFRRAGLKALELENELNIPLHIQLPTLTGQKETKQSKTPNKQK